MTNRYDFMQMRDTAIHALNFLFMNTECTYEEFKLKNRYIHFYQFKIFAIKAAEKQSE